jgi:hypothetical protein
VPGEQSHTSRRVAAGASPTVTADVHPPPTLDDDRPAHLAAGSSSPAPSALHLSVSVSHVDANEWVHNDPDCESDSAQPNQIHEFRTQTSNSGIWFASRIRFRQLDRLALQSLRCSGSLLL